MKQDIRTSHEDANLLFSEMERLNEKLDRLPIEPVVER
jgi:hypothetical protein